MPSIGELQLESLHAYLAEVGLILSHIQNHAHRSKGRAAQKEWNITVDHTDADPDQEGAQGEVHDHRVGGLKDLRSPKLEGVPRSDNLRGVADPLGSLDIVLNPGCSGYCL